MCEQQWRSFLKEKRFKQAGKFVEQPQILQIVLEGYWKSICQASHWRNKVNASHSLINDQAQVKTISKAIFLKTIIKSKYLVFPGQSIQHYEWRFMPVNMNDIFPPPSYPISTSKTKMPSSNKLKSTSKLSTTSMAKTTGTNKQSKNHENYEKKRK